MATRARVSAAFRRSQAQLNRAMRAGSRNTGIRTNPIRASRRAATSARGSSSGSP